MAQVEATVVLSVVVRSGPVKTAVNGTVVARPARVKPIQSWRRPYQLGRWARPVLGDNEPRWQAPEGSAAEPRSFLVATLPAALQPLTVLPTEVGPEVGRAPSSNGTADEAAEATPDLVAED
jgi:hypothetical protein